MISRLRLLSLLLYVLFLYGSPVVLVPALAQNHFEVQTAMAPLSTYHGIDPYEKLLSNGHTYLSQNELIDDDRAWTKTNDLDDAASTPMLELKTRVDDSSRFKKSLERTSTLQSKGHAFVDVSSSVNQNDGHAVLDDYDNSHPSMYYDNQNRGETPALKSRKQEESDRPKKTLIRAPDCGETAANQLSNQNNDKNCLRDDERIKINQSGSYDYSGTPSHPPTRVDRFEENYSKKGTSATTIIRNNSTNEETIGTIAPTSIKSEARGTKKTNKKISLKTMNSLSSAPVKAKHMRPPNSIHSKNIIPSKAANTEAPRQSPLPTQQPQSIKKKPNIFAAHDESSQIVALITISPTRSPNQIHSPLATQQPQSIKKKPNIFAAYDESSQIVALITVSPTRSPNQIHSLITSPEEERRPAKPPWAYESPTYRGQQKNATTKANYMSIESSVKDSAGATGKGKGASDLNNWLRDDESKSKSGGEAEPASEMLPLPPSRSIHKGKGKRKKKKKKVKSPSSSSSEFEQPTVSPSTFALFSKRSKTSSKLSLSKVDPFYSPAPTSPSSWGKGELRSKMSGKGDRGSTPSSLRSSRVKPFTRTPTLSPAPTQRLFTLHPSEFPITLETGAPSGRSSTPTPIPSLMSAGPSAEPSLEPSTAFSEMPSIRPSTLPSTLPSASPSIGRSQIPSFQPSLSPSLSPTEAPVLPCNLTFWVFNADSGERVGMLQSQAESEAYYCIPYFNITIEAKPAKDCPPAESALLSLEGPLVETRQENIEPYFIFGVNPENDDPIGMQLEPGFYSIDAQLFDMDDLKGELITSKSLEFEARSCTTPTASPTISPRPTAIRSNAPTISMAPTETPPTTYPRPPETLFGLIFEAQGQVTDLQLEDAGSVVLRYLEQFFIVQFENNSGTELIASFGMVTGTDVPRRRTWFDFTPLFSDTSENVPTQEEIDGLIETAFQDPNVEELLAMLSSELPSSNPLSATTSVTYQK